MGDDVSSGNRGRSGFKAEQARFVPKESIRELAARHVSATRQIIADQRAHIIKLESMGVPTNEAEQNLNMFLDTLKRLEDHERWVGKISN
jgi:hypothetical protein